MSSIMKTGIELLSIFPRDAIPFGGTYGFMSALNAYGYLQYFTPLGAATAFTSTLLTIDLLEFTGRQITSLKWVQKHFKKLAQVNGEIFSIANSLSLLNESHPHHKIFTDQLIHLNKSRSNIYKELAPYICFVTIASFAVSYFTHITATAFVNRALTSAVTHLPNHALSLASSLSISPIGFVIGIIGVTGFLITLYRESLKPEKKPKMIMHFVNVVDS